MPPKFRCLRGRVSRAVAAKPPPASRALLAVLVASRRGYLFLVGLLLSMASLCAQTASSSDDGRFVPEVAREAAAEGNAAFSHRDYERARRAYLKVVDLAP